MRTILLDEETGFKNELHENSSPCNYCSCIFGSLFLGVITLSLVWLIIIKIE
jgi:hypothetical protein